MSTEKTSTKPQLHENGFYFQRPELDGTVSQPTGLTISLGALASRMVLETRTRTIHPDGRAENVAEHSHMLSRVVTGKVRLYRDRLPVEITEGEVSLFADIHDDIEAYVLDTATDFITPEGLKEKEVREALGARQLYLEFKDIDPIYAARVLEYEEQKNPNARLTKLTDKDMTLLIHIPNKGSVVRETYESKELFLERVYSHGQRLREQFPEFAWMVDDRDELGEYVADLAFSEVT